MSCIYRVRRDVPNICGQTVTTFHFSHRPCLYFESQGRWVLKPSKRMTRAHIHIALFVLESPFFHSGVSDSICIMPQKPMPKDTKVADVLVLLGCAVTRPHVIGPPRHGRRPSVIVTTDLTHGFWPLTVT